MRRALPFSGVGCVVVGYCLLLGVVKRQLSTVTDTVVRLSALAAEIARIPSR